MSEVTVANISHYRRPYKVIVQEISPSSLLQRMADVAAVFSGPRPQPMPAYATVTPIDRFQARRIR